MMPPRWTAYPALSLDVVWALVTVFTLGLSSVHVSCWVASGCQVCVLGELEEAAMVHDGAAGGGRSSTLLTSLEPRGASQRTESVLAGLLHCACWPA